MCLSEGPREGWWAEIVGPGRALDTEAWRSAATLIEDLVQSVAQAYGVTAKVEHLTAVPPTVNEPASAGLPARTMARPSTVTKLRRIRQPLPRPRGRR